MSAIARASEHPRLDAVRVEQVDGDRWREAVERELGEGGRFLGLHAAGAKEAPEVRCLFAAGHQTVVLRSAARAGRLPTIVDLLPAANWDEREAHDAYGVVFEGHEPLRPLLDHDPDLARWTVPVRGHDPYQVAVGPIHAGVIESGHFRFHVVGERILYLDVRLFYNHRGLERAAEGTTAASEGIRYAQRACAGCAVTNSVAYAHAYEAAAGLWPNDALADLRTLLLELERLWNHLNDISAICAGVGFAAGAMAFASLKERAQRLNERTAGHRFLFDTITIAGSPLVIDRDDARTLREDLRELRADSARYWRELQFNSSVQARLTGVGTLTGEQALALGTVGPAARAAGIRYDRRQDSPRLGYASFTAAAPSAARDLAARLQHPRRDRPGDEQDVGVPGGGDDREAVLLQVVVGSGSSRELVLAAVAGAGVDVAERERAAQRCLGQSGLAAEAVQFSKQDEDRRCSFSGRRRRSRARSSC